MRHLANGEACNVAGESKFTVADGVEIGLSMAFEDAGLNLSDGRWQRLCKNAASEIRRQLRKAQFMDEDIDGMFAGTSAGTTVLVLKHILHEQRRTREEQQRANTLLERLLDVKNTNGTNGAAKRERIHA